MIRPVHAFSNRKLRSTNVAVCLGKQIRIAVELPADRASDHFRSGFRKLEIADARSVRRSFRAVGLRPRIGHGDGTAVRDRDPFKHHILPAFGLILMPGEGPVVMEGNGAGAVVIYGLLALDLALVIIDKVCFAGTGIADGQRIGVQLADNDPASQLPGAAAPFNGNKRLVIAEALYQGMRPVALILPDEVHHGILPVRVFLEHGKVFRAFVQQKRDLRLGRKVFSVLCPFYEEIARLRRGQEGVHSGHVQADIDRLCRELRIDLRCLLALGICDMAPALNVDSDNDRCLRHIHRCEIVGLAALNFEFETVFALFGNGNVEGIQILIPAVQVAAQGIPFLMGDPADCLAVQHQGDSPALIAFRFGEINDQMIAVFVFKGTLPGPFFDLRLCGLRFSAGCQCKKHADRQNQADQLFHVSFLLLFL